MYAALSIVLKVTAVVSFQITLNQYQDSLTNAKPLLVLTQCIYLITKHTRPRISHRCIVLFPVGCTPKHTVTVVHPSQSSLIV